MGDDGSRGATVPVVVMQNGSRVSAESVEGDDVSVVVTVAGGGKVVLPRGVVRRVEGAGQAPRRVQGVARPPAESYIDPGLGRPDTGTAMEGVPERMPVPQPEGAEGMGLGFRSDEADYGWVARELAGREGFQDAGELDEQQALFGRSVEGYNAVNPGAPLSAGGLLDGWRRYWAEQGEPGGR